jgi:predicted DNA-binding protein
MENKNGIKLSLRIRPFLKERLQNFCDKSGITPSEVARVAIAEYLNRNENRAHAIPVKEKKKRGKGLSLLGTGEEVIRLLGILLRPIDALGVLLLHLEDVFVSRDQIRGGE